MNENLLTLPNILTLSRIILTIPFFIFIKLNYHYAAAFTFFIAAITDFLDGYLSRKYKLESKIGSLLDPLADKILYFTALFLFIELNYVKAFPVFIIIFREFIATVAGSFIFLNNKDLKPNIWAGKLKNVIQFLSTIIIILKANDSNNIMILVAIITFLSLIINYLENLNAFSKMRLK